VSIVRISHAGIKDAPSGEIVQWLRDELKVIACRRYCCIRRTAGEAYVCVGDHLATNWLGVLNAMPGVQAELVSDWPARRKANTDETVNDWPARPADTEKQPNRTIFGQALRAALPRRRLNTA
jgi:hypothetical protein